MYRTLEERVTVARTLEGHFVRVHRFNRGCSLRNVAGVLDRSRRKSGQETGERERERESKRAREQERGGKKRLEESERGKYRARPLHEKEEGRMGPERVLRQRREEREKRERRAAEREREREQVNSQMARGSQSGKMEVI